MATEIRVPALGDTITEATVAQWLKSAGDTVVPDEPLVELETDKVTVEVPAPAGGVLAELAVNEGDTVEVGALLGAIAETGAPDDTEVAPKAEAEAKPAPAVDLSPAVRKAVQEHQLDPAQIPGSGKNGRLLKQDVAAYLETAAVVRQSDSRQNARPPAPRSADEAGREERIKMSRLRQTIARRLKEAQNTAAMLTTFNEVDMGAVMELRRQYRDEFQQKYGVKLGLMGFFIKACVNALKEIPAVNAEIDGDEIVYKNYYHIGIAVGTEKGLVVPVIRDADRLGIAEMERAIADFAARAREGKLTIDEMQGGTFTISNGGVYGSLMSTPILNAPQSGILGMHKIEDRAVVRNGGIKVAPMMYLALSYDHRLVDGKEAVTFLVRVKEAIEDPERLLLEV